MKVFPQLAGCGILLVLVCSCPRAGLAQTGPKTESGPREICDVPYTQAGKEPQELDLYLPADDGKAHPLVVWIHGGAWKEGGRRPCPPRQMTGYGYAVASISYRFSQQAIFPAQIEDCKAAIRFLRGHAAEYRLDPARVGVAGESAGGHLAAMLGTAGHARQFDVGEYLDQSSAVQCVIDLYGPSDLLHWGDTPDPTRDKPDSPLAKLIGGTITAHRDAALAASPVSYVDKDAAPFLIFQGDKDPLVPAQQSQVLDAALRKAGVESTLFILPGAGHGGADFFRPLNVSRMVDFFQRYLRGTGQAGTGAGTVGS